MEPPYLESLTPSWPVHPLVAVRLRGHDFPTLEAFQAYLHRLLVYAGMLLCFQYTLHQGPGHFVSRMLYQ